MNFFGAIELGRRALFASTIESLARLFKRYSDRELAVIADFLRRNGDRLREETRKLSRDIRAKTERKTS